MSSIFDDRDGDRTGPNLGGALAVVGLFIAAAVVGGVFLYVRGATLTALQGGR